MSSGVCEQHRRRPACATAQSDQRLCYLFLEGIIFKLAAAEETGLSPALSETSMTDFVATRPISYGSHVLFDVTHIQLPLVPASVTNESMCMKYWLTA